MATLILACSTPTPSPDAPTSPPDTPTSPPDTPTSPPDTPTSPPDTPTSPPDTPSPAPATPSPAGPTGSNLVPDIGSSGVVRFQFPDWIEEAPGLALAILTSDMIVRAELASLDSGIIDEGSWGHWAHLTYRFASLDNLKGSGGDDLLVRLDSGPKYQDYPDVFGESRTEQEAHELASWWLSELKPIYRSTRESILFLRRSDQDGLHEFLFADKGTGHGGHPIVGRTWLHQDAGAIYLHGFTGLDSAPISLLELDARIKDLESLASSEYRECILSTLQHRDRLLRQYLGTYRELTLGGWFAPRPLPQYSVLANSGSTVTAFSLVRPPIEKPRFSDYWLEGKDKDHFEFRVRSDSEIYYEIVDSARWLPEGKYSVIFGQHHQSLPCAAPDIERPWYDVTDAVESLVTVTGPSNALHEAMFDPVTMASGVGADASRGRLAPATFSLDDSTRATITGLWWDSGVVTMRLRLVGRGRPEGSIAITGPGSPLTVLNFPLVMRAGQDGQFILQWGFCDPPWKAGELLLLTVKDAPYQYDDSQEECAPQS